MLTYIFTMTLVGIFAGILGALLGLGGGIVITPVLTLLFGVDSPCRWDNNRPPRQHISPMGNRIRGSY